MKLYFPSIQVQSLAIAMSWKWASRKSNRNYRKESRYRTLWKMWHYPRLTMWKRSWKRNVIKFLVAKRRTQQLKRPLRRWKSAPPIWLTLANCKKISKKRNPKVNWTPFSTSKCPLFSHNLSSMISIYANIELKYWLLPLSDTVATEPLPLIAWIISRKCLSRVWTRQKLKARRLSSKFSPIYSISYATRTAIKLHSLSPKRVQNASPIKKINSSTASIRHSTNTFQKIKICQQHYRN